MRKGGEARDLVRTGTDTWPRRTYRLAGLLVVPPHTLHTSTVSLSHFIPIGRPASLTHTGKQFVYAQEKAAIGPVSLEGERQGRNHEIHNTSEGRAAHSGPFFSSFLFYVFLPRLPPFFLTGFSVEKLFYIFFFFSSVFPSAIIPECESWLPGTLLPYIKSGSG